MSINDSWDRPRRGVTMLSSDEIARLRHPSLSDREITCHSAAPLSVDYVTRLVMECRDIEPKHPDLCWICEDRVDALRELLASLET